MRISDHPNPPADEEPQYPNTQNLRPQATVSDAHHDDTAGAACCARATGSAGASVSAIGQCPVDDNRLGSVHIANVDKTGIQPARAAVSDQRVEIRAVGVVVAAACVVHLTQAFDGQTRVLTLRLGRVGGVVE